MASTTRNNLMKAEAVLNDPTASAWLKNALASAIFRDPCDAANDAELLAAILAARVDDAGDRRNEFRR